MYCHSPKSNDSSNEDVVHARIRRLGISTFYVGTIGILLCKIIRNDGLHSSCWNIIVVKSGYDHPNHFLESVTPRIWSIRAYGSCSCSLVVQTTPTRELSDAEEKLCKKGRYCTSLMYSLIFPKAKYYIHEFIFHEDQVSMLFMAIYSRDMRGIPLTHSLTSKPL